MDISVIVPVRDGEKVLERALTALGSQEYSGDYEVIVVNNQSQDSTLKVANDVATRYPVIRVLDARTANGISDALNAGIGNARAGLLATTDQDDRVAPDWLAGIALSLQHWPLVAGVTRMQFEPLEDASFGERGSFVGPPKHGGFLPFAMNCNMGLSRTLWEKLGGFDALMDQAQDIDFSWRAQLSGNDFGLARDAMVLKSLRSSGRARFRQHLGYGRSDVRLAARFGSVGYAGLQKISAKRIMWLLASTPRLAFGDRRFRSDWLAVAGGIAGVLRGQYADSDAELEWHAPGSLS